MLEAEKGKFCAEAEKRVLEEKVQEVGRKLSAAQDKQMEAEKCKRLLEKEFELMMKMEQEQVERTVKALEEELGEARRSKVKMDEVVKGLNEELEKM